MLKNNSLSRSAFSLIELSIVILIIGILVAGVTQSSRLVAQMRLASARAFTQSAPVMSIRDLSLWLETTTTASFDDASTQDATAIQNWYDINTQSISKYNAVQATGTKQPLYSASVINGLPAVKFDGTDDDMAINSLSVSSNSSFFFVVKPAGVHVEGVFDSAPNLPYPFRNYCAISCASDGKFEMWNGSGTPPVVTLGLSNAPYIVYIDINLNRAVSPAKVMNYYKNGTFVSTVTDTDTNDIAWTNPRIGSINAGTGAPYYNGYIAEIIIFGHTLKAEERTSVTNYLGKKWGIRTP